MSYAETEFRPIDYEIGPIDYVVFEWPPGRPPTGRALPALVDLVDRGVIRILDLAFVHKQNDGSVVRLDLTDLGSDPELTVFHGASSGILQQDDCHEAANALQAGSSAALLVYENRWAAPFATAARNGGAQVVASGRIPVDVVVAALDELERDELEREE